MRPALTYRPRAVEEGAWMARFQRAASAAQRREAARLVDWEAEGGALAARGAGLPALAGGPAGPG